MNHKRNIYLNMQPLEKAKNIVLTHFNYNIFKEIILSHNAVGRILAEPINAKTSSPNFNAAAMDGIAVKAEKTFKASETNPQKLTIGKNAQFINTGQVLPEIYNAVIMIENVQILDENSIEIENPAFPWQNIRKIGEDIVATELLFTRYHKISPYCLGALLSAGVYKVPVIKKPKVLIIPTGSELLDYNDNNLKPGKIPETNSYILKEMIEKYGGKCTRHNIITDDLKLIKNTILKAIEKDYDIVLTIGGSSSGTKDFSLEVAKQLGKILIHGITIMPGKPIIVADINSKPFFGIPGYPVSAIIAFEEVVLPMIRKMLHLPNIIKTTIKTTISRKIASKLGVEEFLRVKLGCIGKNIVAIPLPRGAGTITSITEADGIIRIPRNVEGINNNQSVETKLIKPITKIKNTIIAVGSHDNALSVLADELKKNNTKIRLSSSNVGSLSGLISLKKGFCHITGSHLLDSKTGKYNTTYIKKYIPDVKIKLINLTIRAQGIIIPKGNPKNIKNISDLCRKEIMFINRQKGSGTRILLDYKLAKTGLSPQDIQGYSREGFTHMEVAMSVLAGSSDAAIGIFAAANALNLDFIPIISEQYDLIIPKEIFNSNKIQTLIKVINSQSFQKRVKILGGYDTKNTGKVII